MAGRLAGKTAYVSAAGAGIGRATALAFAGEGARVWATDIDEAALAALARQSPGIEALRQDATDRAGVEALAARIGRLDVLFNCAGFVHHGTIFDCDEKTWRFSFDLNVTSMYYAIAAFLPAMLAGGGGSIVNMASVVSSVKGAPNRFVYGATKGAVIGLTKAIAADFVTQGVRCNAICPGTVETPSWRGRVAAAADPEKARRDFIARQPMGRVAKPEEIAALAVYLGSDESRFTTGAIHVIDGGWSM